MKRIGEGTIWRLAVGCPWALCRKISNYFAVYFRQLRGYVHIIHILRFRKWLCRNCRHKLRIFYCVVQYLIVGYIFSSSAAICGSCSQHLSSQHVSTNCRYQAKYYLWRWIHISNSILMSYLTKTQAWSVKILFLSCYIMGLSARFEATG